jgi:hypothetical protein
MIVEMLCTTGCPHAAEYLPRLRALVAGAGVVEPVRVRVISDPEEAWRERFLGSPTVRIDGRDVDPTAHERRDYGVSCRLYAGPAGLRGVPSDEWVLALLPPDRAADLCAGDAGKRVAGASDAAMRAGSAPANPLLEECLLGRVGGELQRTLVGAPGLVGIPERAEELGAGGVVERVPVKRLADGRQLREGGAGPST